MHVAEWGAASVADAGASFVIVGHSERRADHGESDAQVRQKAQAVWRAGLIAIVCIGETRIQRDGGQTVEIDASRVDGERVDALVRQALGGPLAGE